MFTKLKRDTQRPPKLTYIREACLPIGPSKEVKLAYIGARISSGLEASGRECPAWGS